MGEGGAMIDFVAEEDGDLRDYWALVEACVLLHPGSRCTQLVAIITLMNLCTVHGCTNKFVN